jgi:branched-chain amino acid transport system permease protein
MSSYKKWIVPGLLVILLVLMAALPYYAGSYWVVKLIGILMYVILAVSWMLFSGPTGYISLASAAFFGVGVYVMAVVGKDVNIYVAVILGGLFSSLLAFLTGALTLRLRGIYFAMFTFGLVLLVKQLLIYWEFNITRTRGRFVVLESNNTIYYVLLTIFVVLIVTSYLLRRSRFGLALQSIGEFEEAAAHSGINVTMVKILTFTVSAFFAGAVGAIMAAKTTYVDPYLAFDPQKSFLPVLMAIVGGVGQLYGPVVGAAILTYVAEWLQTRYAYYYMLVFGIILVAAILYLPQGLVGLIQKLQKRISGAQRAHT